MNHDSHVFALEFEPLREDCYNFSIVIGNSIQKLRNIVIVQESRRFKRTLLAVCACSRKKMNFQVCWKDTSLFQTFQMRILNN